jgi:hypothetical protein
MNFLKIAQVIILMMLFISCEDPHRTKKMDFGLFTLDVPYKWQQIKKNGIDSYVGAIAVDKSDTLYFDLGMYSNNLTEPNIEIITRQMMEESATDSVKDIIVKDIPLDFDLDADRFRKQNVSWDTIDNRHAKIVFPRISGNGLTGVYIDSLWQIGSSKTRFNLAGADLKVQNEKDLLNAVKTLRFYKK